MAERDRLQPGESREAGRRLVLPKRIDGWSLTSLQRRLVKTGGRLVKHARCYWLRLAESVAAATRGGSSEPCCDGLNSCPCQRDRPTADGADFSGRGGADGTSVSDIGRKRASFEASQSPGTENYRLVRSLGARKAANPTTVEFSGG